MNRSEAMSLHRRILPAMPPFLIVVDDCPNPRGGLGLRETGLKLACPKLQAPFVGCPPFLDTQERKTTRYPSRQQMHQDRWLR